MRQVQPSNSEAPKEFKGVAPTPSRSVPSTKNNLLMDAELPDDIFSEIYQHLAGYSFLLAWTSQRFSTLLALARPRLAPAPTYKVGKVTLPLELDDDPHRFSLLSVRAWARDGHVSLLSWADQHLGPFPPNLLNALKDAAARAGQADVLYLFKDRLAMPDAIEMLTKRGHVAALQRLSSLGVNVKVLSSSILNILLTVILPRA